MVRRYIKADTTTPKGAPRINYPGPWYENVEKILVRVYDNSNHLCIAELDNEKLFQRLMETGRVVEITADEMVSEIARLRPAPYEVTVTLTRKGKNHRMAIEALLKAKDVTYRIEER